MSSIASMGNAHSFVQTGYKMPRASSSDEKPNRGKMRVSFKRGVVEAGDASSGGHTMLDRLGLSSV